LIIIFFIYKGVSHIKKRPQEKKICVKLCKIIKEKPIIKQVPPAKKKTVTKKVTKPIVKPKKVIKKPKPKPKPKPKKKPKPKPKPKPKKKPKPKPEPKPIPKKIIKVPEIQGKETYLDIDDMDLYDDIEEDIVEEDAVEVETTQQRVQRVTNEYINNHEDEIRQMINDNLYYPRRARKRGVQGEVKVKFTLSKDAEVSNIIVLSSKSDILSRAAIKTLNNLSKKFPKPDEELVVSIPILYKLR
jgi:protein TonB